MERNKYQKIIAKTLGTRQIAFNPDLAKILGSAKAGLFLSQLLFWWGKGKDPNWVYKTREEFREETALSFKEQLTAQKLCQKIGAIEVKYRGVPPKRHFSLKIEKIVKMVEEFIENPPKIKSRSIERTEKDHLNEPKTVSYYKEHSS